MVITGGFTLVVADSLGVAADDSFTVAHVSLFRTASAIWVGSWSDQTVALYEVSAGAALGLVHTLLRPATDGAQPAPTSTSPATSTAPTALAGANLRLCASCGASLPSGARFCASCGHPVQTAQVN